MTRHLGLGCVLFLAAAGSAMALDNEDAAVTASVSASCSLTTLLDSVETLSGPFPGEHNLGDLGYTCNFGNEVWFPSLKIQAPGGTALVNSTDGHSVQYRIKWNAQIAPAFHTAAPPVNGNFVFSGDLTAVPNVEVTGSVIIDLLGDLTHAGTYSDILTFSVSP